MNGSSNKVTLQFYGINQYCSVCCIDQCCNGAKAGKQCQQPNPSGLSSAIIVYYCISTNLTFSAYLQKPLTSAKVGDVKALTVD